MTESGLLGGWQRARNAADAVRAGTEKARSESSHDPANAPAVILAKAATKVVLDSIPIENPAIRDAVIKKAGEVATHYETGTRPLSTPSGDAAPHKRMK